ncbi:DUF3298 and DUF4163 domain-containing protein [Paenibacillus lemnae]|uniref:DUF3298 and DUF4163 domain-containing protein n=1 Tax=Paenibacillus lemnae TaxID=1330551 RepID=A0A848M3D9_PAELE|nr:DUF3298 and DUF4163 domain-containing protein [Paenibacillus lemnae]NMO95096.1 DUF3298 and DUF4163 domain-containing protein [Paenibacillus lemnae]
MSPYEPPVQIQTMTYSRPNVFIQYPQVRGLASRQAEERINRTITMTLQEMERIQQTVQTGTNPQITVHYEIKTNERGILSLLLSNYTYSTPMAHGYTAAKGLTFSTASGQLYRLSDLFKPGSNYEAVLIAEVNRQIKERNLPVLNNPVTVQRDQDFYLADKALVLFYPLYAITPYYVGIPMFPISVYTLQPIIAENGPLAVLAADVV